MQGSESSPNFQLVNKPSQISPHKVLQSWLINTVYHLLVKNNYGRGSLLIFFPWKGGLIRGRGLIWEGGFIEDLQWFNLMPVIG